ncbi:MAG: iron ABC transporter permease [Ardenticatenaceae bacterium]|nr:iron ABC transporter permease [Ardenticatenaceae bacterium]
MFRYPWLFLLPFLFLLIFFFYPLSAILGVSLFEDGRLVNEGLQALVTRPYYRQIAWFTLWQATASTILTIALALPGAYVFARYRFWGKSTLKAMSTLPFVLPTVVVASAFSALLGPRSVLNEGLMVLFNLQSPPIDLQNTVWIILLAHIFYNYSVALRMISSYWQNLSPEVEEAAAMLGANPRQIWWRVTLPRLQPAVNAAAVLVFIFTFTSFGVILILGGPRFSTLETEIYRQAANLFNLPVAATLSLLQIAFTFVLMVVYTRTQARLSTASSLRAAETQQQHPHTTGQRIMLAANLTLMILLLGAPLLALIMRSLQTDSGYSLLYYTQLFVNDRNSIFFVPPIWAAVNSAGIALVTMVMAVLLGLLSAVFLSHSDQWPGLKKWLDPLMMLPLATSAVTLGFGFIIALNRPPFDLRRSLILVPIAHTLVALPFVIRAVLPALRRIPPSLPEAAAMLGASPWQASREIIWPLIRSALLVGAVFAFTISMGEFGASVFVTRPNSPTMPVAIARFLSQPGSLNFGRALAMSTLLMGICTAGFLLIERFRIGDEGEF